MHGDGVLVVAGVGAVHHLGPPHKLGDVGLEVDLGVPVPAVELAPPWVYILPEKPYLSTGRIFRNP